MRKRIKMKELEAATGVGRETIRFYIREGLLPEPERPGRNVAWYDESFIERIALIKELQQKRFLPLQMIKAVLDADMPSTPEQAITLASLDGKLFLEARDVHGESIRLSAAAERSGITAREIRKLEKAGVLAIETHDGDQWLDRDALRIAELWGILRAAGYGDEIGIGPERLRLYSDFIQVLAREELRVFADNVGDKVDTATAAKMGEVGIEAVNEMLAIIRKTTLLREIREASPALGNESLRAVDDD